jgi:hypothetical protein
MPEAVSFANNQSVVVILILAVGLSLLLNGAVIWYGLQYRGQIRSLSTTVRQMLKEAVVDLKGLEELNLRLDVHVQDTLPVATDIPLQEEMNVTVRGAIPVRETLTTPVIVRAPGFNVPVQVTIPLDFEVPINMELPVSIQHEVPVKTTVPIDLNLPLEIDLSQTELGSFVADVREKLSRLEVLLSDSQE